MATRQIRNNNRNRRRGRSRRRRGPGIANILFVLLCLIFMGIMVAGGYFYIKKYAPTTAKLPLDEYYTYFHGDEASVVINDALIEAEEDADTGAAIVRDGHLYLERYVLKDNIDDRYAFDDMESVMRYVTDSDVISVPYEDSAYTVSGEAAEAEMPIVITVYDHVFVACDFAVLYSDFTYSLAQEPYRAAIYTAGFTRDVAKAKSKAAVRRLGGPKSKILTEVRRGASLSIIKNHGKWSNVVTEDGVIGYVKNRQLGNVSEATVASTLDEREYRHELMDETVIMAWDMVLSESANDGIEKRLAEAEPLNVISPTWYNLNDDRGGIDDRSDAEYVKACHDMGLEVWVLINDIEVRDVDHVLVLNTTSSRDRLIDNLMTSAASSGIDGINVDFEHIPVDAVDGYLEFIRELSLRCHEKGMRVSVDNYAPAAFNEYYNRHEQSLYADYIVLMAYDEYYSGGEEAGSNSSLPFVKEAAEATLKEVPAEQFICGLPFYCREWMESGGELTSKTLGMDDAAKYIDSHKLTPEWDDELGLNYTEYTDGDTKHMLWIEDERSFEAKLEAVKSIGAAGYSFWKLGHEIDSIWAVISKYE